MNAVCSVLCLVSFTFVILRFIHVIIGINNSFLFIAEEYSDIRWRRKWQPTPVSLPGEFCGQRSLVGSVCGVAKSQTRLVTDTNHSGIRCIFPRAAVTKAHQLGGLTSNVIVSQCWRLEV